MSVNSEKYAAMQHYVQSLKVKDIRQLFAYFRKLTDDNPDIFFPAFGLTASEFAVVYIQNMVGKPKHREGAHVPAHDVWDCDDAMEAE
jgi:hypothetical protein